MKIIRDNIWLCGDCLFAAANDDYTGLAYHYCGLEAEEREKSIRAGLAKLGPCLVPDFDSESGNGILEFSRRGCDCCGSGLAGELHRFAILGEEEAS